MRKVMTVLIIIMLFVSFRYYCDYKKLSKDNDILIEKKKDYLVMSNQIEKYSEYEKAYSLVIDDGLSLEEKLKDLEKDISVKSERVSYYKNSIDNLNNKMK